MTPEQLRQNIIQNMDAALANPLLHRFLSVEAMHQLKAERQYWLDADGEALLRLLAAYNTTA